MINLFICGVVGTIIILIGIICVLKSFKVSFGDWFIGSGFSTQLIALLFGLAISFGILFMGVAVTDNMAAHVVKEDATRLAVKKGIEGDPQYIKYAQNMYYAADEEEKKEKGELLKTINMDKAEFGLRHDMVYDRHFLDYPNYDPIDTYWDILKSLYFTPILVPYGLLGIAFLTLLILKHLQAQYRDYIPKAKNKALLLQSKIDHLEQLNKYLKTENERLTEINENEKSKQENIEAQKLLLFEYQTDVENTQKEAERVSEEVRALKSEKIALEGEIRRLKEERDSNTTGSTLWDEA